MDDRISHDESPLIGGSFSTVSTEEASGNKERRGFPYRYILALLHFGGFGMAMSLRLNFNIALVAMVNFTSTDNYTSDECQEPSSSSNTTHEQEGDFQWDAHQQSLLLGGFFYGYILTQFVGGYAAEIVGPKIILLVTILGPSLINLITPVLADWSFDALFVSRVIMGIAQGPLYPASNALWSRWAPAEEKTKLVTFSFSGACVGYVATPLLTGFLCELSFLRGWPLSFYLVGIVGVIWSIFWLCFAQNSPETYTWLSPQERNYIMQGRSFSTTRKTLKRPWRSMFTSMAVWAVFVFNIFDGLAYYALFSGVPVYMKQILKFDISENGMIYSAPFIGTLFVTILGGLLADWVQKKGLSTRVTRNIFVILGEGTQVGIIIGMGFLPCSRVAAVTLYMLAMTFIGFNTSGSIVNLLDIAPKYAGTLVGMANFLANIGGFVSPLIVGAITKESPDRKAWQKVFFLTGGAYALATLSFLLFGRGEEQPWAKENIETLVTEVAEQPGPLSINSGDVVPTNGTVIDTKTQQPGPLSVNSGDVVTMNGTAVSTETQQVRPLSMNNGDIFSQNGVAE